LSGDFQSIGVLAKLSHHLPVKLPVLPLLALRTPLL
jgi:hypothetical protein